MISSNKNFSLIFGHDGCKSNFKKGEYYTCNKRGNQKMIVSNAGVQ